MKSLLNSRLLLVGLIFLAFWLVNTLVNVSYQRKAIDTETKSYEGRIYATEQNNKNLETFLKYYNNPAFLEREARIRFNYKLTDEQVAFVYKAEGSAVVSKSFGDVLKTLPNYKRWFYYLSGY